MLSAALLYRAELVAAGVPAGRFATESVPDGAVPGEPPAALRRLRPLSCYRNAQSPSLRPELRPTVVVVHFRLSAGSRGCGSPQPAMRGPGPPLTISTPPT